MEEIWKDITNYENLYQISNYGNVKSFYRNRLVHFIVSSGKYYTVRLRKDGIEKRFRVHLLVWEHFGDKPRNGMKLLVDHIDENKLNNKIDNLQLLTNRENVIKSRKDKRNLPVGITYCKRNNRYRARIWDGKWDRHIGYFICPIMAINAYEEVAQQIYYGRTNATH